MTLSHTNEAGFWHLECFACLFEPHPGMCALPSGGNDGPWPVQGHGGGFGRPSHASSAAAAPFALPPADEQSTAPKRLATAGQRARDGRPN